MSILKARVEAAIFIIMGANTRPPQIDFVSPGERVRIRAAEELLESMPTGLHIHYMSRIFIAKKKFILVSGGDLNMDNNTITTPEYVKVKGLMRRE